MRLSLTLMSGTTIPYWQRELAAELGDPVA